MHYLYFVKIGKAKNSADARKRAQNELEHNGFVGDGGYFGGGKSDWFVIGGRWSGELQELLMKKEYHAELKKVCPMENEWGHTTDEKKKHAKQFQTVWEKLGGKGKNPYARSQYDVDGYEDDATKITAALLKAIQKHKDYKEAEVEVFDADNMDEYAVKDLKKSDIGKWLVVVDYHN